MTTTRRRFAHAALGAVLAACPLAGAPLARAAESAGLPLPDAPVRLLIPDAGAFDRALSGAFRGALDGTLDENDPVATAWRRTQVGSKLEAQWSRFSSDLAWTWDDLQRLQPRGLALALLDVGQLEALLVVDTPLAELPLAPPEGEAREHRGAAYRVVAAGAGDRSPDPDRRMGLAWARHGGRFLLATSERALKLGLDAALDGRGFTPPLGGLAALELDLDALRRDRYFRREFLFDAAPEKGRVHAALRLENGRLVEVRQGAPQREPGAAHAGETRPAAPTFDWPRASAVGWEPDGATLGRALRAALLEPLPLLADKPVPARAALPPATAHAAEDALLVRLDQPLVRGGGPAYEEGELAEWRALLGAAHVDGWGYAADADGRRLVFAWPEARQAELEALCRRTLERRAGRVQVATLSGAREFRIGPALPVLALKRTGNFVWVGPGAQALAAAPTPQAGGDLLRWGRVDLDAARREGARWERVEGAAASERVRPFSDRILGLLGWMPATRALSVERRRTGDGWTERVEFTAR